MLRSRWGSIAALATLVIAAPACDSGEGMFSLPNEPEDASLSDGPSAPDAGEAAVACAPQNVCSQHGDCLAATCDCGGRPVAATERCVDRCCQSVYVACLRVCADAGDGASDAADAPAEGAIDAPADSAADAPADSTDAPTDGAADAPTDGADGAADAPADSAADAPTDSTDGAADAPTGS